MRSHKASLSAALAFALGSGCAPVSEDVDTSAQHLEVVDEECNLDVCPDPLPTSPNVYRLTSLEGTTLSGINSRGRTFSAPITAQTKLQLAKLNQWPPTPVRAYASAYNDAVQSGEGVLEALRAYVAQGGTGFVVYPPTPVAPIRVFRPVAVR
jgi:hypothetical protein